MTATIQIVRLTSTGPTATQIDGTNNRVNAADVVYTNQTTNPITIPGSGSNYSYWCSTRLNCTVAPATSISNIKFYTDGSNGFGTGITCVGNTATGGSYVQATGTPGTTGDILSTGNYSSLAGAPSDVFAYTSGSPLAVTGSIGATTGQFGDMVVYQFVIGTSASSGASNQETFTFAYDEV